MEKFKRFTRFLGTHVDPKGMKMLISAILGVGVYSLLALFLPMTYPMFILNTLFVVTQINLALTKAASLERLVGTAASIALGLAFYFISGGLYWIVPLGLVLAGFLSFLFFRHIVNVLLLCTTMLMFNTSGGHPFEYATARVINTLLGLVIALVVALLYTHPYPRRPVYEQYRAALKGIDEHIATYEQTGAVAPAQELLAAIGEVAQIELKMTKDTGVLSADFRKRIIALSGDINQIICQFAVLQALPTEDAAGRSAQRGRISELQSAALALLDEMEAAG